MVIATGKGEEILERATQIAEALAAIGFLDPAAPKKLMPRLNQMFNRAQLTQEEIHILRGVAKSMLQATQANR